MPNGPLSDVTVIELTLHRAGPFCGALLADLGADVVKIERPGNGDPARTRGAGPQDRSGYFMANNRNKRSVTVDLKTDAGVEAVHALIDEADVFIENYGPDVAERLDVGYETLRKVNPGLVYASIKGYGETGPFRNKKGMDLILQAEAGIMSVTGPAGGDPVKVGQAVGDLTAGLFATIAILARLYERDRVEDFTGKFDVGLFDAIVSVMNEYLTLYSITGEVPGPQGTSHQTDVPYQLFETADGYVVTAVPSDDRWDDFVDIVGREEIREYRTNAQRVEHESAVVGAIEAEFAERTTDELIETLTAAGFPAGTLNDVADVVGHDQTQARRLVRECEDGSESYLLPGHPVHFPDYSTPIHTPPPELGEHTEDVFTEMADQTRLDRWEEAGAFGN